jgi:hypothetical protein
MKTFSPKVKTCALSTSPAGLLALRDVFESAPLKRARTSVLYWFTTQFSFVWRRMCVSVCAAAVRSISVPSCDLTLTRGMASRSMVLPVGSNTREDSLPVASAVPPSAPGGVCNSGDGSAGSGATSVAVLLSAITLEAASTSTVAAMDATPVLVSLSATERSSAISPHKKPGIPSHTPGSKIEKKDSKMK